VALREKAQGLVPSGLGQEVGDHDDQAAAAGEGRGGLQQYGKVGRRPRTLPRPTEQRLRDPQHVSAAAAGRYGHARGPRAPEQHRADTVAAPHEHVRDRRRELRQYMSLVPGERAEAHGCRGVEQQPRGQLAILEELPHVRGVHPRRHVPVDVAQVVARHVLADVRDVEAGPAVRRAVVTRRAAVQAPYDPPLEAPQ